MADIELLTPDEVAQKWRVTSHHVRALVRSGRLRALRVGVAYRIPRAALIEFEQRNTMRAKAA